ncbi:MAG: hypothetical protein DMF62_11705 [Acidobacteria bacterium]|nr:MAG: hypothetical protein DMF62_11705 [Acidobacteriota bacterium]
MRRYSYSQEELAAFYRDAKPSEQLQARLDNMKSWSAKRLATAVPAWAKPTMLPATFKPQLSQRFTHYGDTTCKCTRVAADFADLSRFADDPAAYIAEWNRRWHLLDTGIDYKRNGGGATDHMNGAVCSGAMVASAS